MRALTFVFVIVAAHYNSRRRRTLFQSSSLRA
jgi:hypothetical protein